MATRRRGGSIVRTIVLATMVLVSGGLVVANSPLFYLKSVEVRGNDHLTNRDVMRLAGIRVGENVLTMSSGEMTAGLLESPWVLGARVDRRLPSTIVVEVQERDPVGFVRDSDGYVVLSSDGTILRRAKHPPAGKPSLGRSPRVLAPGGRYPQAAVLEILGSFPRHLLGEVATGGLVDGTVVFELRDGGIVVYGEPELPSAKNGALVALLRWAEDRGIPPGRIDVRAPRTPAFEPAR